MSRPRLLFALSADFGEYVTASLFSRGQPFDSHFALPRALMPYAGGSRADVTAYERLDEVEALAARRRADLVVLASGYMYPVNRIARPEALRGFVERLRGGGSAVATTDPWLRTAAFDPAARLEIHSVQRGGVDPAASRRMRELQRFLEGVYSAVPHLYAVPLAGDNRLPFFNPDFTAAPALAGGGDADNWLFVLSREDYVFLAGFERDAFFSTLLQRLQSVLSVPRNRVAFIGPAEVGAALAGRWPGEPRLRFLPFCAFDAFETELRCAQVVAYWNTLSSSLLYCLYHRVPPIFFGKGHQARVCPGLYEHVVENVYCGLAPALFEGAAPLEPDAGALTARLGSRRWLDAIAARYGNAPAPAAVVERARIVRGCR